jgi:hypothetical protein
MTLKEYVQAHHPDIYQAWVEHRKEEIREYKKKFARENYGRITPKKRETAD